MVNELKVIFTMAIISESAMSRTHWLILSHYTTQLLNTLHMGLCVTPKIQWLQSCKWIIFIQLISTV